ncbi:MAG: undecaprenyldiphospho-muramoylpentapeptide beta-N-acetylglucosaminyltransferase [Leptolyngbya sp. SIO4C1]|nr:undecaprenyldiphospho-muramoylpentapeptide beta-N-acetylglucosaminyltransferase [Leptolyngbya sp. SIO4C1]
MADSHLNRKPHKLLIAASGTGGHLFPAIATAEQLSDYKIEWLGVPDRLETELVPQRYPLHMVRLGGVQGRLGLGILRLLWQFLRSTLEVRQLLKKGSFQSVFTTGGYIAAPAIVAARSLGLPAVLHESNALPGKVTRWLSPWCSLVALGFAAAARYLPRAKTLCVGTPVRQQFLSEIQTASELSLPEGVPVILVVGGSQGAVAVNRLVRAAAPAWLEAGAWVVHQTGSSDPETESLVHPHYVHRPFYHNMAALLQRATLVIGRAGAGTLTELAITHTPALLIPYPFAADDHQAFNAAAFAEAGAALVYRQATLTAEQLQAQVLALLQDRPRLDSMAAAAGSLAVKDSAQQLAEQIRQLNGSSAV